MLAIAEKPYKEVPEVNLNYVLARIHALKEAHSRENVLTEFQIIPVPSDAYVRVCYYTNWAQYRPAPMTFYPENIDVNLCTHLVYAFAQITNNELAPFEWNDESIL